MLFNKFKQEWPYYFLLVVVILVTCSSLSNMLSFPLTSNQMQEIKTKITAYNLEFVSVESRFNFYI
jgi:hypothetical protein